MPSLPDLSIPELNLAPQTVLQWVQGVFGDVGDSALLAVGGVAVVVGVLLLLGGRVFHRALLGLAAGATGVLLGRHFGPRIGLNLLAAQAAAALSCGLLGVVLARLAWSVVAGAHLAFIAAVLLLATYMGHPAPAGPAGPSTAPAGSVEAILAQHGLTFWPAVGCTGLGAAVGAFLLPRATVVVVTALVGTEILAIAALAGLEGGWPDAYRAATARAEVIPAVVGGTFLLGVVFQAARELRARRGEGADGKAGKASKGGEGDG